MTAAPPALRIEARDRQPGTGRGRAGARRRTPKTGRWLRPIRLGIGASNYATRSAPSSNSCAQPSRTCARSSIRRKSRSKPVDSVSKTQARHSGNSTKPGHGAAVAFGGRCENVRCCRAQGAPRATRVDHGSLPAADRDHAAAAPVQLDAAQSAVESAWRVRWSPWRSRLLAVPSGTLAALAISAVDRPRP